jgi:U2 small nuclear ribonucleoprotein A'
MKITAELIQQSPQFTNPLNERQLDLRGYKITAIENMGATLVLLQPFRTSSSAST